MILLTPLLLASCLALNTASDQIAAGDLASAFPGLQSVPPETPLAFALRESSASSILSNCGGLRPGGQYPLRMWISALHGR
jgi:hypothetical protein